MYRFKLPIGDWSDDGHGQCEWLLIDSSESLKKVRDLYFKTKEKTEDNPENICEEYEDNTISQEQIEGLGLSMDDIDFNIEDPIDSHNFAKLFIVYMVKHNPGLDLRIVKEEKIDMFPFYGYDDKKRHISFMGYGIHQD